jgi:hypothetical protein
MGHWNPDRFKKEQNMDLANLLNGVTPEQEKSMGALPQGGYDVAIEKVEPKSNDNGWKALNFQLRVVGEKFNNAVVFDQVTIAHSTSEKAVEIGKARLAKIAELCGTTDTANMLGKQLNIYVGVKEDEYNGNKIERNVIWNYSQLKDDAVVTNNVAPKITTDDIPF